MVYLIGMSGHFGMDYSLLEPHIRFPKFTYVDEKFLGELVFLPNVPESQYYDQEMYLHPLPPPLLRNLCGEN